MLSVYELNGGEKYFRNVVCMSKGERLSKMSDSWYVPSYDCCKQKTVTVGAQDLVHTGNKSSQAIFPSLREGSKALRERTLVM